MMGFRRSAWDVEERRCGDFELTMEDEECLLRSGNSWERSITPRIVSRWYEEQVDEEKNHETGPFS